VSNIYEQMLLTDKSALSDKIRNLVEEQLNNYDCDSAKDELDLIATVIDFSYTITDTCSFSDVPGRTIGNKTFGSIEDYEERDQHYEDFEDAEGDGVEWDEEDDFYGTFGWDNCPKVSVMINGVTKDASKASKTLWEDKCKQLQAQSVLKQKHQHLTLLEKQLLQLQAEIAAAEGNA